MAEFSYTYQSVSTFNPNGVRNETRSPVGKPFAPFVPKTNGNSEGYVTKKKIVPVASKPYGDDPYSARDEGEWRNHQQTSPVRGSPREVDDFITKVLNEPNRPTRSVPVTSPHHSPIGATIKNDRYDGTNGYGDYSGNRKGRKPFWGTNEDRDGYNGYGRDYDNYGNREGRRPIGSPEKKDFYDGYNGNPKGYGGGYGDYNKKEGHNPTGSPVPNGYNNGYGHYGNGNDKEKGRPAPNNNYDDNDYGHYGSHFNNKDRPYPAGNGVGLKSSPGWTPAPRKGTQLSEPTDDINKAIELLKNEAAKRNGYGNNGGHYEYDDNNERRYDGPSPLMSRPPPTSKFDKGIDLINETERLNKITTGAPESRSSVPNRDNPWSNANSNHSLSRPRFKTTIDGRGADATRYGVINHREAEKKFQGMTI